MGDKGSNKVTEKYMYVDFCGLGGLSSMHRALAMDNYPDIPHDIDFLRSKYHRVVNYDLFGARRRSLGPEIGQMFQFFDLLAFCEDIRQGPPIPPDCHHLLRETLRFLPVEARETQLHTVKGAILEMTVDWHRHKARIESAVEQIMRQPILPHESVRTLISFALSDQSEGKKILGILIR